MAPGVEELRWVWTIPAYRQRQWLLTWDLRLVRRWRGLQKDNLHCFHSTGYATLCFTRTIWSFARQKTISRQHCNAHVENALHSFTLQVLFLKWMVKTYEESSWLQKRVDRNREDWMSEEENTAQIQGHCRQLCNVSRATDTGWKNGFTERQRWSQTGDKGHLCTPL